MNNYRYLLTVLFCVLLLTFFGGGSIVAFADYDLINASDLHYIAPSLTDGGAYYQRVLDSGDSKFMPEIEAITAAFFDEVIAAHPDALLLTGDLTFNGAIISHEALIEKLHAVEAAGIPVLVQTGNHDVYNSYAASFYGDSFSYVPSATSETFKTLYADFGPNEALSMDPDSLSYIYPLSDDTWILMLDLNTEHDFCGLSEVSLRWVEQQLAEAQEEGVSILAAGHQNLFQHSIFRGGYVFTNADKVAALFERYGVPLYLSGHLHIQHIVTENGVTEIATSALCSYPCQYGMLHVTGERLQYETKKLDMAAWAERNGKTDEIYRDFPAAAAEYMIEHFKGAALPPAGVGPEEWEQMQNYLLTLNLAYFAGDLREAAALDPDGTLAARWLAPGDLTALYVASLQNDIGKNFCTWESEY